MLAVEHNSLFILLHLREDSVVRGGIHAKNRALVVLERTVFELMELTDIGFWQVNR